MEIAVVIDCPENFRHKAHYVFKTLFTAWGIKLNLKSNFDHVLDSQLVIYYGPPDKIPVLKNFQIPTLFIPVELETIKYFNSFEQYPIERIKYFTWQQFSNIPTLFYSDIFDRTGELIEEQDTAKVRINVDLIASAFYFLSCWQEYTNPIRDEYDRFPFQESIQCKLNIPFRPVVNEYLEVLGALVSLIAKEQGLSFIPRELWPQGKSFSVCLTHDIDHVRKWRWNTLHREGKTLLKLLIRRQGREFMRRAVRLFAYLIRGQDPYWVYSWLVKEEGLRGFHSSFYFLGGKTHPLYDQGYGLNHKKIPELFKILSQKGAEIGLHGSFETYQNQKILKEQVERIQSLGGEAVGNRQHYLRFDVKNTWNYLEQAGLKYDTTLGFAESCGFRASYAYPFNPYNVDQDRPYQLLEIPLLVMDGTLKSYLGLGAKESSGVLQEALEVLAKYKGCGALLWHNGYFDQLDCPGFGDLYLTALDWVVENHGWGASGREIYCWWQERERWLKEC